MANPYLQQVRRRQLVYTGLIAALFIVSLLHRRYVVEPAAENLLLREVSRGEAELTGSALRLTLTGSRGLAVTILWYAAREEQERHKWNEVELLVGSITKLQPYFITPWLYQSWNLSFNVAVECDQPRDKYYYISRGLVLLAEGERRNTPKKPFPASPDMRHHIGFTYQLKIGRSDEKNAMQCLLDLSLIDPIKRDPELLKKPGYFEEFLRTNPRLARRLFDKLDRGKKDTVLRYLKENQVIPTRFSTKKETSGNSALLDPKSQFPILPPQRNPSWPDPDTVDLTTQEVLDVNLFSRTWYSYAQEPLPDPDPDMGARPPNYNPVYHRLPKMASMVFRGYPCVAQRFIAENLQSEGWFDKEGWTIPEEMTGSKAILVGTQSKYHCRVAWDKAYQMYKDLGVQNGMYIPPEELRRLKRLAKKFEDRYGAPAGKAMELSPSERVGEMEKYYLAHQKLAVNEYHRRLTNYDDFMAETEASRDPQAILARKWVFQGKRLRGSAPIQALKLYKKAVPLWFDLLLRYPNFRKVTSIQEESYETEFDFSVRLIRQEEREKAGPIARLAGNTLRRVALGMASEFSGWPQVPWDLEGKALGEFLALRQVPLAIAFGFGGWPHVPWNLDWNLDQERDYQESIQEKIQAGKVMFMNILPIRNFRGPYSNVLVFQPPEGEERLKQVLTLWSHGGDPLGLPIYPSHTLLTTTTFVRQVPFTSNWKLLIPDEAVQRVRNWLGLDRGKQGTAPPGPVRPPTPVSPG